jgi:phosphoribosylaminoimidazole carboxylase (NCAIR synthetase)
MMDSCMRGTEGGSRICGGGQLGASVRSGAYELLSAIRITQPDQAASVATTLTTTQHREKYMHNSNVYYHLPQPTATVPIDKPVL